MAFSVGFLPYQKHKCLYTLVDISLAPLTLLEPVLYRLGSRSVLGCNRAVYHTSLNTLITTPTHLLSGHGRAFGCSHSVILRQLQIIHFLKCSDTHSNKNLPDQLTNPTFHFDNPAVPTKRSQNSVKSI